MINQPITIGEMDFDMVGDDYCWIASMIDARGRAIKLCIDGALTLETARKAAFRLAACLPAFP